MSAPLFFSIITPTHNRSQLLERALCSVLAQTYCHFEHIIINDSPDDESYNSIDIPLSDTRIRYFINEENKGVNFSRNKALGHISSASDYVIFLDDDDYFHKNTLLDIAEILSKESYSWLVTKRLYEKGTDITKFPKSNVFYDYLWSYLFLKRIRGDATHIIKKEVALSSAFLQSVKQGEEWFYFYKIGIQVPFFMSPLASTLTDGYQEAGLNFRKRSRAEVRATLRKILQEGRRDGLTRKYTFLLYMGARYLKTFLL